MKIYSPRFSSLMLACLVVLATQIPPWKAKAAPVDALQAFFADQFGGKLLSARAHLQRQLKKTTDLGDKITLLDLILQNCAMAEDDECVRRHTREITSIPLDSKSNPAVYIRHMQYLTYWAAYENYLFVQLKPNRAEIFGRLIDTRYERQKGFNPIDADIFLRRQFLCARMYLEIDKFGEAQRCLDKALAHLLAFKNSARARHIVLHSTIEGISLLLELGELERAWGIYVATLPVADLIPRQSMLHLKYRLLQADILEQSGNVEGARRAIEIAVEVQKGMELSQESRAYFQSQVYLRRAAYCVMAGDVHCATDSLKGVPFHKEFERAARAPQDQMELNYLAARAFTAVAAGQGSDAKVLNALRTELGFEVPGVSPKMLSAFRNLAVGLAQQDPALRAPLLLEASQDLIAAVRARPATALGSSHRPGAIERTILMLALLAHGNVPPAGSEPLFLALQMLSRNGSSFQMDALGTLAGIGDEALRKRYQRALRFRSARDRAERFRITAILREAAGAGNGPHVELDEIVRIDSEATSQAISQSVADFGFTPDRTGLVDLRSFQATLGDREAALYLAPTFGSRVAYMCVRRNAVHYLLRQVPLQQLDRDERLVQAALTATHAPSEVLDRQFPAEAAVRLHDELIKPFEPCLRPGDTIQWLPGAYFLKVPLAVLLRELPPKLEKGYDLGKARWLVLDHPVSYAGSASLLKATRSPGTPRNPGSRGLFGIGDPLLGDGRSGGYENDEAWRREINKLQRLPDSRDELVVSAAPFPNSRVLVAAEATEAAFRAAPASFRYLSFATHAIIRDDAPGLPGAAIVLTRGAGSEEDDGLLTTDEIASLDLNAEFVALSACNTASYDYATFADEVPALGLAFALAGVPATLATLWPVDSHTSKEVVSASFRHLAGGRPPSSALAEAQRGFLAGNTSRAHFHPRFWSPFIILGDGGLRAR